MVGLSVVILWGDCMVAIEVSQNYTQEMVLKWKAAQC